MMTDPEIIQQVLTGQIHLYADLVRKHHQNILGLCLSLLKNPTEAEDAAQDSFLKAYRGLESFRQESEFSTWIYRIAYRTCLDALRKKAREKQDSWEQLLEERGEDIHRYFSTPMDAEKSLSDKNLVDRVLATMNESYRYVLVLREIQGLSYEEIAEVMDCSLDSVKARIRRARQDLQRKIQPLLSPNTSLGPLTSNPTESLL